LKTSKALRGNAASLVKDPIIPYHSTVHFSHNLPNQPSLQPPNPAFAQEVTDTHLIGQHNVPAKMATRLYNALRWQGAHTYADIAALGLYRLSEESCYNRIAPLEINHQRWLSDVFADQTNEELQKGRLPWCRLSEVYTDLRAASPAVLLPAQKGRYAFYARHYMSDIITSKRRLTLGDMINRQPFGIALHNTTAGVDISGFVDDLATLMVEKFDKQVRHPRIQAHYAEQIRAIDDACGITGNDEPPLPFPSRAD
jgi:hypothetical protein